MKVRIGPLVWTIRKCAVCGAEYALRREPVSGEMCGECIARGLTRAAAYAMLRELYSGKPVLSDE